MPVVGYRKAVERAMPGCIYDILEKSGMRFPVVRKWLRVMHAEGACHIGGWDTMDRGCSVPGVNPVFVLGPGVDVPLIEGAEQRVSLTRNRYRELILSAMPGSRGDIEEKTSAAHSTVWRWIKLLHAAGDCHITGWVRPPAVKGQFMPVYTAGSGKDMPCKLTHMSSQQKQRRYRQKARADGRWAENRERANAKSSAKYWAAKAEKIGDPLVQAMFGGKRAA